MKIVKVLELLLVLVAGVCFVAPRQAVAQVKKEPTLEETLQWLKSKYDRKEKTQNGTMDEEYLMEYSLQTFEVTLVTKTTSYNSDGEVSCIETDRNIFPLYELDKVGTYFKEPYWVWTGTTKDQRLIKHIEDYYHPKFPTIRQGDDWIYKEKREHHEEFLAQQGMFLPSIEIAKRAVEAWKQAIKLSTGKGPKKPDNEPF